MAYKEVSRVEITEVIRQWQARRGIREITRSTGLARKVVLFSWGKNSPRLNFVFSRIPPNCFYYNVKFSV